MSPLHPGDDIAQTAAYSKKILYIFLLIFVLTFLCFVPSLFNALLEWDDAGYIVENEHIRNLSFNTVHWAFFEFYNNYWAPLTWVSLAIDYAVWGLNPVGYHLTNNLLHALNAGMFFLLSFHLLKRYLAMHPNDDTKPSLLNAQNALYCSLFAALFFALHPLRVESVAWAAERKDVLSTFFGIPAVIAYIKHTQQGLKEPGRPDLAPSFSASHYYWLALGLFCLSLLSKATLVTLPAVLLIVDWFPLGRLRRKTIKRVFIEKIPFMILTVIASALTVKAFAADIKTLEYSSFYTRMLFSFHAVAAYIQMTLWPLRISPVYLHPGNVANMAPEFLLPIFFFVGITVFCIYSFRRWPMFMSVWLIYLLTLLPVIGLIQAGPTYMAARFTYLPGMAISLLIAIGITSAVIRVTVSSLQRLLIIFGAVLVLLFNSFITVRDIGFWRDDVILWTRVIDVQPREMGLAHIYRSLVFEKIGDHQNALADISKAFAIAEQKKYKGIHELYYVRARVLKNMGNLDGAIIDLGRAIETSAYPKNHFYYMERGMIYEKQGKQDLAAEDFRLATTADQVQ